ncbi:MAG: hypothetical protein ACUVTD_05735 [Nitrososphaerales archaeon]
MEDCNEVKAVKQLMKRTKQPMIAVETLPMRYEDFKPWLTEGCTLLFEFGKKGKRLDMPLIW